MFLFCLHFSSHECLALQNSKDWIEALQIKFNDFPLHKDTLSEDETEFWNQLQKRYLEPLKENKEQQQKIAKDLKELRNKVTFAFFVCNALWLVATFFLQTIGNAVTLSIPKMYPNGTTAVGERFSIDPVSLMFLLSFSLLLLMQFLAMLYHRIYTLIHFVAYVNTETKTVRKYTNENDTVHPKVPDISEANSEYEKKYETVLCIQNPAAVQ
ncbi:chitin synthase-like [Brachyhypopomus gauderio]|uniref:chitin synthase-like n=1 Tax=Brachyhypopomus gauderio TaxID=698409 RepID=UPI0040414856